MLKFKAFILMLMCCELAACNSSKPNLAPSTITVVTSPSPTPTKEKEFVITEKQTPVIKPSNIIDKIRVKLNEYPETNSSDLAEFGNKLIKEYGYDFTFSWEPKGKKNETNLAKAGEKYYPFYYNFSDTHGNSREYQLMNDDFGHPCFSTIYVPAIAVSESQMSVRSNGTTINLRRPKDFETEEVTLVDDSLKKILRKWKTPIDSTPIGISEDGTKIFFESWEFLQNQMDGYKEQPINLAIEISEDGSLRFVDEKEIKSSKGVDFDYDKKYTEIIYTKYKVGDKEYKVKYSAPCT